MPVQQGTHLLFLRKKIQIISFEGPDVDYSPVFEIDVNNRLYHRLTAKKGQEENCALLAFQNIRAIFFSDK